MKARTSKKSTGKLPQGAPGHSRDLLLALSRAAQSVLQSRTADEIYQAIGGQIKSLGHDVIILTLNEEKQYLDLTYTTFSKSLIKAGEKLTGFSIKGYGFPVLPDSFYGRVIKSGMGEFGQWTSQLIAEALPEAVLPLAGQLARLLKIEQSVSAPLCVDGKTLGMLTVASSSITEDDIPAIQSFAVQVAISLKNISLTQQMQEELSARRKAEERLQASISTYEGIFNSVTEALYILDENGIFINVNLGAKKMYGYPPEYFVGRTPEFLSAPGKNDLAKVVEYIHQAYLGQSVEFEFWGLRKDGSIFPKDVRLTPGTYFGRKVVIAVGRDVTEHKRIEDALKKSEAQYRLLAEHTTDTIWLSDMSLKTTYVSPSLEKIRGYTLEQLQELPLDQNLTPASFQLATELFAVELLKVMADPNYMPMHTLELEFLNRDGTVYSTETKVSLIRDENGNPVSIIGESRDIADRRRIEKTLFESERYYRALIENAPDGILVVNADGKIRYESPAVARLLGYEPNSLIGTSAFDLIDPDHHAQVADAFAEGLNTPGFMHRGEYRLRHSNGEWRYFELVSHYLLDDPVIAGIIVNGRDITERKGMEDALQESERNFHSVISESADGIILSDEAGKVIEFNNASEEITGWSRENVLGRMMWDFQNELLLTQLRTPERYEQLKSAVQLCLKTGNAPFIGKLLEAPFERSDGSVRYVQQRVFPVKTREGWRLGSVSRDVTERKQMEESLRASEERSSSLYKMIRLMTDNLPDLVWAKDMNGRFLFANKAVIEKLLIAKDTEEPIGKTDLYFSEREKAAHPENPDWHTFGELGLNADDALHSSQRAERFEEFGNVKGQFLFLDVYQAPFLDEKGNILGTVGIGRDMTREKKLEEERNQVQEALADSESELRALFASMQDTVLVIDRDGVYRKIAPTNPGRLYISPDEVIGKHLTDLFPPEQVEKFLQVIEQVLATRQTLQIEYEFNINGQSPWYESSISPMGADSTLWVARDISERKQIEAKLHLQSAALEAAANTILITDREGIIQWANSSFTNLTGFDALEAIGKKPSELIKSGKQSHAFYKNLWDTILSGNIWHNELVNRRKDDSLYFEEMTITPLHNLDGEISHFIAIKQDVTERKQAEAALIKSEQAYRALFENMPIGLYRTSIDGYILDANLALVNMFGYPDRSSLLKMKTEDLYVNPASNIGYKDGTLVQGGYSIFEVEFRRHDQTTFWAEDYFHIIYDKAGASLYYEGSLIDITNRKRAEEELLRATKSLEAAHRELQQTLMNEQMLARTDVLTGLYNRRYFHELAAREFVAAVRYQRPLTIMLFDLDELKLANDTFGHEVGDKFLIQVSEIAAMQVRNVDVLARYGGDEFIVLFPQTNATEAFLIAERIRANVESAKVATGGDPLSVTISVGIAELDHTQLNKSVEDTIRYADKALYHVKNNGKNRIMIFTQDLMDNL